MNESYPAYQVYVFLNLKKPIWNKMIYYPHVTSLKYICKFSADELKLKFSTNKLELLKSRYYDVWVLFVKRNDQPEKFDRGWPQTIKFTADV